jgi:hypothetical protein
MSNLGFIGQVQDLFLLLEQLDLLLPVQTSLQKTTSTHVEKTTHRRSSVVAELLRLLP